MIKIENLTKDYGTVKALKGISLTIEDGEIFGLLGHNGAGKSTLIKSLVSIIYPTSGDIFFDGLSLEEHRDEIKKSIGYVADSPDLFLKVPANFYWNLMASAFEIPDNIKNERLKELIKIFELNGFEDSLIEGFSHGMRQKVFIIGALLANPKFWILDEPMTGLDPQSSHNLKNLMKEHSSKGRSVIFSTHVLEVAESLCTKIAILHKGRILFLGTMENLRQIMPGKDLEDIYLNLIKKSEEEDIHDEKTQNIF